MAQGQGANSMKAKTIEAHTNKVMINRHNVNIDTIYWYIFLDFYSTSFLTNRVYKLRYLCVVFLELTILCTAIILQILKALPKGFLLFHQGDLPAPKPTLTLGILISCLGFLISKLNLSTNSHWYIFQR